MCVGGCEWVGGCVSVCVCVWRGEGWYSLSDFPSDWFAHAFLILIQNPYATLECQSGVCVFLVFLFFVFLYLSMCSGFPCPNNCMAASVWNFERAHSCWCMRLLMHSCWCMRLHTGAVRTPPKNQHRELTVGEKPPCIMNRGFEPASALRFGFSVGRSTSWAVPALPWRMKG